jgi:hypothetical protein
MQSLTNRKSANFEENLYMTGKEKQSGTEF